MNLQVYFVQLVICININAKIEIGAKKTSYTGSIFYCFYIIMYKTIYSHISLRHKIHLKNPHSKNLQYKNTCYKSIKYMTVQRLFLLDNLTVSSFYWNLSFSKLEPNLSEINQVRRIETEPNRFPIKRETLEQPLKRVIKKGNAKRTVISIHDFASEEGSETCWRFLRTFVGLCVAAGESPAHDCGIK